MDFIEGKYTSSIFTSPTGYHIGLFRVRKSSDNLKDLINKTVTFTGYFHDINNEDIYHLDGEYIIHERYGPQFQVKSYERVEPEGKDAVVTFLTSSFIKGCGEKTAQKIVNALGDDALKQIKQGKDVLLALGLSDRTATSIYNSVMRYYDSDEAIIFLKSLEFSSKEISQLLALYGTQIKKIIEEDIYSLVDIIDFKKLDRAYFKLYNETTEIRIRACIIETLKRLSLEKGDTYSYKEEIYNYMLQAFQIDLYDVFDSYIAELEHAQKIKVYQDKYYLMSNYEDEQNIANILYYISQQNTCNIANFANLLEWVAKEYQITYNDEQIKAIKSALEESVCIITGGPGTGKTTIINGLLRMYQYVNNFTDSEMSRKVALLAPTGRASKRMSETTNFGASTIHRYLKWNHETNEFAVNENNPNNHSLIIVDEVSMVDNFLMSSLLKGINPHTKLVLVGDENQLPSVGPGNILKDLIASDIFCHIRLVNIYRQSENSFIPLLAKEIREQNITSDIENKRDDYNFIASDRHNIKMMLQGIVERSIAKGLTDKDMQILIPMYKGENGIDNINMLLQDIFNPPKKDLKEVMIGPITYRVNDKVINLVNNIDQNIFNGDIGYIVDINRDSNTEFMKVDFYGNFVYFKRDEVGQIRHAYAMSIHKSQGSEFNHVIMPFSQEYNRMLYNKLVYTGVSRAKKSLVIIGNLEAFLASVKNNYSIERKTNLKDFLMHKIS